MTIRNLSILLIILLFSVSQNSGQNNQTSDGTLRRIQVPILMYHYISPLPPDADEIRTGLTVHPERFREHLQYLQNKNYTSVSLYEVSQALQVGAPLPQNPIVLTFDDGYIDHFTHAKPILEEYGFTGTFFIITALADENNINYMSWQQIQNLSANGMEIAAHTKTHPDLRYQDLEALTYEIVGSYQSIEAHTQAKNIVFAYPGGKYNLNTLKFMKTVPIPIAVTTENGQTHTSTNILEIARIRMTNETSIYGLDRALNDR